MNRRDNATSASTWRAVKVPGEIEVLRPAFLFYDEVTDDVLISSFGRTNKASDPIKWPLPAHSSVLRLPGSEFKTAFQNRRLQGKYGREIQYVRERRTQWPNKLSRVPQEYGDYIVVPDGFIVPLKGDGNIYFADRRGNVHRITDNAANTFYHEVEWHDFNGDGLKDMLTVRVNKNGFTPGDYDEGDMMWLENPGPANFLKPWKPHYIAKGPDVIFKSIPHNGGLAVFCTEFFRTNAPHDDPRISVRLLNSRGEQTAFRIIDDNIGLPFAVTLDDLDGDGIKELIATNHQDDTTPIKAAVYAYEVPWNDLMRGEFKRHTLVYHPSLIKRPDPGAGAPGFAYPFYPKSGMTGPKHILVAGDGTFDVWYLRPTGGKFQYETQIVEYPGTTGELLLKDWDGDGIMDVLVPDNDEWGIHGISFEER
jgi:hypothetical protein